MSVVLASPTVPAPPQQPGDATIVVSSDPTFAELRDAVVGADYVIDPDTAVVTVLEDGRIRIRGSIRSQHLAKIHTTRTE